VMTGKSELTSSLRERLAFALAVEPLALYDRHRSTKDQAAQSDQLDLTELAVVPTLHDYLTEPARLSATLRTLPSGNGGRRLKRALLNAVEDLAVEAGQALPLDYSDIRRRVLAGEL
jgi:hypothetical protein